MVMYNMITQPSAPHVCLLSFNLTLRDLSPIAVPLCLLALFHALRFPLHPSITITTSSILSAPSTGHINTLWAGSSFDSGDCILSVRIVFKSGRCRLT